MQKTIAVAALAAMAALGSAHAQEGTPAQRAACRPDALRLCHPGIPDILDHSRVIACLQANRTKLSADCRAVFGHR